MKYLLLISLLVVNSFSYELEDFMTRDLCGKNQVIDKEYYSICYNKKVKGPVYVTYSLDLKNVDSVNIKKRPRFYTEKNLKSSVRTKYAHYSYSIFQRGHVASDAFFDYDLKVLKKAYTMANIVPQYPDVNQRTWRSMETAEHKAVREFGKLDVVNIIKYDNPTDYMTKLPFDKALERFRKQSGKNRTDAATIRFKKKYNKIKAQLERHKIVVPSGFYKILSHGNWKKCYYVDNLESNPSVGKLPNSLEISCSSVKY